MIKLLDDTKSLSVLASENTNGLGQIQAIDPLVTEELNGIYELEFNFLQSDLHFKDLKVGGLLKCTVNEQNDEQIFRIYYVSKPINQVVNVKCQHISYDLNKIPVEPFTATGAVNVKNGMVSHMMGSYPFTMETDITNVTSVFTLDIPRSFRECLGGYEGSILDVFRCEYEWDNLTVRMLAHRGSDQGVRISYGKNLTDFKQEENVEGVYTSVLGYAVVDEVTYVGNIFHKVASGNPKVKIVDFSSDYSSEGESSSTPTVSELTDKAQNYANRNSIEVPNVTLTISFVPLYQTEEYKNIAPLERVSLGDTVHVFFDKLDVEASSRVIKTVWNVNLNRYDSIELGNTKASLNSVINDAVDEAKQEIVNSLDVDTGFVENQLDELGSLIINGLGLHKTMVELATGGYRIYLHNKETLAESDVQYVMSASGLLVSTDYGQTWNAGFDAEGNAVLNSLATITLKALEIVGSTITFGDPDDLYITASPYSLNDEAVGISFDGSGYVRFQPQQQFIVNNLDANGNYYNRFLMSESGSVGQPYLEWINYDKTNHLIANFFEIDSRYYLSSAPTDIYNRAVLTNYNTLSGTRYSANHLILEAHESLQRLYLRNFKMASSNYASQMYMTTNGTTNEFGLYNYHYADTNSANNIYMTAAENLASLYIRNYKADDSTLANYIAMLGRKLTPGSGLSNSITISNYDVDGSNVANSIAMNKSSAVNSISVNTYRGGTSLGGILLSKNSANNFTIELNITGQTVSGTTYKGCSIRLDSNTGNIVMTGTHLTFNGTQIA